MQLGHTPSFLSLFVRSCQAGHGVGAAGRAGTGVYVPAPAPYLVEEQIVETIVEA